MPFLIGGLDYNHYLYIVDVQVYEGEIITRREDPD